MDEQFRKVVTTAASGWPVIKSGGDPNTIDLWWLARRIEQQLGTPLPTELPTRELGVVLIDDCVEKKFINGLIRNLPTQELVTRAWSLVECAGSKGFSMSSVLVTLAVLLHAWTGCIGMAKSLRKETSGREFYTPEMRQQGYDSVKEHWEAELGRGNPWLRYGVTLARSLEKRRGNVVVEDWIPKDSPYWD